MSANAHINCEESSSKYQDRINKRHNRFLVKD